MSKKKPQVDVLARDPEPDLARENAELRKRLAGYAKTIHALQEQLAEAKSGIKIELLYGQQKPDGRWETDWEYTAQEARRAAEAKREELRAQLQQLDAELQASDAAK
ncbi:MAG: hypothetical protein WA690_03120 [Candidatus Acidiferrales bacterium]